MESIAEIMPKALRRGKLGRQIKEQELLEAFEMTADQFLPGDLRSYVRGMYVRGNVLTIASLSGYATELIKTKQTEILAYIKRIEARSTLEKLRILA